MHLETTCVLQMLSINVGCQLVDSCSDGFTPPVTGDIVIPLVVKRDVPNPSVIVKCTIFS